MAGRMENTLSRWTHSVCIFKEVFCPISIVRGWVVHSTYFPSVFITQKTFTASSCAGSMLTFRFVATATKCSIHQQTQ